MLGIIAAGALLCGCRRVIETPRDELVQFSWYTEEENGNILSLSFSGEGAADLTIEGGAEPLTLSGLCAVYDDHFVICDTRTEYLYTFSYVLHGDCIDLTFDEGTVTLDKVNDSES